MQLTEQELWQYIDGELSATEAGRIEDLIETRPEVSALYQRLLQLHLKFKDYFAGAQRDAVAQAAHMHSGNRVN